MYLIMFTKNKKKVADIGSPYSVIKRLSYFGKPFFLHWLPEVIDTVFDLPFFATAITLKMRFVVFKLCKTALGAFEERSKACEAWKCLFAVHAMWFAAYRFDKYGWGQ